MKTFPIIELVVKIASRCNLNCSYCYEYNLGDDSWKLASKFMSNHTAVLLGQRIQEHMVEFNLNAFSIGLHGGEPLLMSPHKIDLLLENIKGQINPDKTIHFGIQTNGILLSLSFIEVFKKHNVKVSISIDGIKTTHDKFRVDHKGLPSWDKVVKGINLIKQNSPELFIGLLSVIDIESDPIETFDFLAQFGVDIDFLLPLNNIDNPPYYPKGDKTAYGKWYYAIYREWVNGRNSHIDVRFIKNIITQFLGGTAIYEVMTSEPIGLLTISTDGNIEGLDCLKSAGNGIQITNLNLQDYSFTDALEHEIVKIRQSGINSLHEKCKSCEYLYGCAGGYLPNRYSKDTGFNNPSVYCEDLYWLLSNIEKDLKLKIIKREPFVI